MLDAWSTLQSAIGGNISKPITGETRYTVACIDRSGATQTKTATARIIPGFRIHADTLAHLGPLERMWAKKLIAEGTWRLVPDYEVMP